MLNEKNGYIFAIYWLQFYIVTWQSTAQQSNLKRTKVDFGKINGLFRHHSKRSPNSNSLFLFSSGFVSFSSVLPVFFSPICYTSPANFSLKCIQAQKKIHSNKAVITFCCHICRNRSLAPGYRLQVHWFTSNRLDSGKKQLIGRVKSSFHPSKSAPMPWKIGISQIHLDAFRTQL